MVPKAEAVFIDQGIILLKYFLTVGEEEQERRFRRSGSMTRSGTGS